MESQTVSQSQVTMTELILPTHANALGTVFGGAIVSWVDICAAICAQRHSGKNVVTASIDELHFFKPAYTGWVLSLKASVNYTGKTSMEIGVRVSAENPKTKEHHHIASSYLTFVALGQKGEPIEIPPLALSEEHEKRRWDEAVIRRKNRLQNRKEIQKRRETKTS